MGVRRFHSGRRTLVRFENYQALVIITNSNLRDIMANHIFELGLTPPPGVAFIQWSDGSIRIRYATKDVVPIRSMLLNLARSLTEQAINKLQAEREVEIAKQRMPLTRLQTINTEMASLKKEMTGLDLDPIDLSGFERAINEGIRSVEPVETVEPQMIIDKVVMPTMGEPVVVIGTVVPDFED